MASPGLPRSSKEIRVVFRGLDHPECVNFGIKGQLYAGGEAGQVYRIDLSRSESAIVANTGGFILGVAADADDNLYACDSAKHCVHRISEDGTVRSFVDGADGKPLSLPNYGLFDDRGNYYLTDSGDYWHPSGRLLRVQPDGTVQSVLGDSLSFPNGLALSAGGERLFVVESTASRVLSIALGKDGTIGPTSVYAQFPGNVPDGLAVDGLGNLYVSCYTPEVIFSVSQNGATEVLVRDPTAELLNRPTNVAFGPGGSSMLYIANFGGRHVSALDAGVPGLSLRYPRL